MYEIFDRKKIYIGEGELIVGDKGDVPQAAPTFPELCCHTHRALQDEIIERTEQGFPDSIT